MHAANRHAGSRWIHFVAALAILHGSDAVWVAAAIPPAAEVLKSELVFSGAGGILQLPIFGAAPAGDFDHLYISEQRAARLFRLNLQTKELVEVLDLPNPVPVSGIETGLSGFAFHPDFASNGKVYVSLSGYADGSIRILEYTRSATNPDIFDPATEREILRRPNPTYSHNAGWLGFGPQDGNLYIATGDGGNVPPEETKGIDAQNVNSLNGKVLRLDVDGADFYPADETRNYAIPATNPFAAGGGAPEVFAWGLRHPFRNSFDRETGDLYIADVGSDEFEEINFLPAGTNGGQNYGWRPLEGFSDSANWSDPAPENAVYPIYAYPHVGADPFAVIGGYVYRGSNIPWLQGAYFFNDWWHKNITSFRYDGNVVTDFVDRAQELVSPLGSYGSIPSFAEDAAGELYMLDYSRGNIYRIAARKFVHADFNVAEVPSDLEQSPLNTAATFDGAAATFSGIGAAGRSYLRTIDDDLHTTSFTAEVTVTLDGSGVSGSGFFGLGVGDPQSGFAEEPRTDAHVFIRVDPSALGGSALLVDNGIDADPATSGEAGDGTHRLRINYDASTKQAQFVIGDIVGGRFVPTAAFSAIDTSNNGFDGSHARLFFGGADGVSFDDFSHRYFEGTDSLWTGASDASYGTLANWSPAAIPDSSANIYFTDTAANFTVDLGGDRTVQSATFAGASGYTLNSNTLALGAGDVTVVGSATHTMNSNVTILSDGLWDIEAGATLTLNGTLSDGGSGFGIEVTGGGTLNLAGALNSLATGLITDGTVNVGSGATASIGDVSVGSDSAPSGTSANLVVSGAGTSVTQIGSSTLTVGSASGASGTLSLIDGGTAVEGFATGTGLTRINSAGLIDIDPGGPTSFNVNGNILVDGGSLQRQSGLFSWASGKTMTVENGGRVLLGDQITDLSGNSVYVAGDGSLMSVSGGGLGLSDGSGLYVTDGGAYTASATSTFTLNATSVLSITDGIVVLGNLVANGGTVDFNSGSLSYGGDLAVGNGGLLGSDVSLASNRLLSLTGTTTVDPFHTLTLDGGTLNTGSLLVNGTFLFNGGTLGITGAGGLAIGDGGPLGKTVTLAVGRTLHVTGTTTINADSILAIDAGASSSSGTIANSGTVALNGVTAIVAGTSFVNAGLLRGEGLITASLANQTDAEVRAETGKLLTFQGVQNENAGRINLLGGTIEFAQSLTNGETGQILGHGNLFVGGSGLSNQGQLVLSNDTSAIFGDTLNDTGNNSRGITITGNANVTFWDDVTHVAGSRFKVESGSSATFFGTFGGAGNIIGGGDVYFESDLTPGASPAEVTFDADVHLGNDATSIMEIGGTMPGTQYDRLNVTGGFEFGGKLEVSTINGFAPAAGDSFDLFNWAAADGAFASLDLPALASGLTWYAEQLYTTGVLRVVLAGDYNGNGVVDAADYTVWCDYLGQSLTLTGENPAAMTPGVVDQEDYDFWRANFGAVSPGIGAGSGAGATGSAGTAAQRWSAAVPEPGTIWLATLAVSGGVLFAGRRSRRAGSWMVHRAR